MKFTREGDSYSIHTAKWRLTVEGLGKLLILLGVAGVVVFFLLSAIF